MGAMLPPDVSDAQSIVNCRAEALVLVAFAPLQIVPGTYWNVVSVAALVTVAAPAVTAVGSVRKLVFTKLLTAAGPVVRSAASAGRTPLLFVAHSVTPPLQLETSSRRCVLRALRCKAGTAKKTISKIKPAMARTIKTSMIVKPSNLLSIFSFVVFITQIHPFSL